MSRKYTCKICGERIRFSNKPKVRGTQMAIDEHNLRFNRKHDEILRKQTKKEVLR